MNQIRKYPRTPHLLDSKIQAGDAGLRVADFGEIVGRYLVIEEKVDGANAGLSFDTGGELRLQSRGHYLTGGPRERHFAPFKAWAAALRQQLWERIGTRYVVYGEWLHAKHTIFYDDLPAWFLEFDVLDLDADQFLATSARRALLRGLPIHSVPVLHEGTIDRPATMLRFLARSAYKSDSWRERLAAAASSPPHRPETVAEQTDSSDLMEGLYVKVEERGVVTARYKYVRQDFLSRVQDSESHWHDRPILPNGIRVRADGARQS